MYIIFERNKNDITQIMKDGEPYFSDLLDVNLSEVVDAQRTRNLRPYLVKGTQIDINALSMIMRKYGIISYPKGEINIFIINIDMDIDGIMHTLRQYLGNSNIYHDDIFSEWEDIILSIKIKYNREQIINQILG